MALAQIAVLGALASTRRWVCLLSRRMTSVGTFSGEVHGRTVHFFSLLPGGCSGGPVGGIERFYASIPVSDMNFGFINRIYT